MTNLILKLIMMPIIMIFSASMLTNVNYPNTWQPFVIGLTLAVSGHLLEWALLSHKTFWLTLAADFVTAFVIIYSASYFFYASYVTVGGAIVVSIFLTVIEFFVHTWLIQSGRARKEPTLG